MNKRRCNTIRRVDHDEARASSEKLLSGLRHRPIACKPARLRRLLRPTRAASRVFLFHHPLSRLRPACAQRFTAGPAVRRCRCGLLMRTLAKPAGLAAHRRPCCHGNGFPAGPRGGARHHPAPAIIVSKAARCLFATRNHLRGIHGSHSAPARRANSPGCSGRMCQATAGRRMPFRPYSVAGPEAGAVRKADGFPSLGKKACCRASSTAHRAAYVVCSRGRHRRIASARRYSR